MGESDPKLLAAAIDLREKRPWKFYKLDRESLTRCCDDQADALAAAQERIATLERESERTKGALHSAATQRDAQFAENARLRAQVEELDRNLDLLSNEMVYEGNSVAWIYDKFKGRGVAIDRLRAQVEAMREAGDRLCNRNEDDYPCDLVQVEARRDWIAAARDGGGEPDSQTPATPAT